MAAENINESEINDLRDSKPSEFSHHYANLEGVRIHYVTMGDGAPVVLLHGWPQTWYEWRRVMPLLADKYSLVAPDMRGLGDSSRPSSGYDKKTVANDIWMLMREHLKHVRFAVVGHDWGAPVAFRVAADHSGEVTHLAMLDVPVPGDQPAGSAIGGSPRWWHMFHQVPDLPEALVYGRERTYLEWFFMNGCDQAGAIGDDDIAEYVRTYAQPGATPAGFNFYRALSQDVADNRATFASGFKLPMPTLAFSIASTSSPVRYSRCRGSHLAAGQFALSDKALFVHVLAVGRGRDACANRTGALCHRTTSL